MSAVVSYFAAAVLAVQAPAVADDPRAREGSAAFFNLCGSTVTGVEGPLDASRFKFTKLRPETVKEIRPDSAGQPFWDVQSLQSELRALAYIETNGVCALEIAEASEQATRTHFADDLARLVKELGGQLEQKPDKVKHVEGKAMISSEWWIATPSRTFLVGLTTYPEPRFMTQHVLLLTVAR